MRTTRPPSVDGTSRSQHERHDGAAAAQGGTAASGSRAGAVASMPAGLPLKRPAMSAQARDEMDQYVTGLTLLNRAPRGQALQRLADASASMDRTRALLHKGPGNTTDNRAGEIPDASNATALARFTARHLSQAGQAALNSIVVGAEQAAGGNCGEFAAVVASQHLDRLAADAHIEVHAGTAVDHSWALEVPSHSRPDQGPIALDAWGQGPAVLLQDSSVAQCPSAIRATLSQADKSDVQDALDVTRLQALLSDDAITAARDHIDTTGVLLPAEQVWRRNPTTSTEFANQVLSRLDTRVHPEDPPERRQQKIDRALANLNAAASALGQFEDTAATARLGAPGLLRATRDAARVISAAVPLAPTGAEASTSAGAGAAAEEAPELRRSRSPEDRADAAAGRRDRDRS